MGTESNNQITPIDVVCLVLQDPEGAVLVTQRAKGTRLGLLWEFPGGKVEPGEDPESALIREIKEELRFTVDGLVSLPIVNHDYDFGAIRLCPFLCVCETHPLFELAEHADSRWIIPKNWQSLSWAPADIPIIKRLLGEECKS